MIFVRASSIIIVVFALASSAGAQLRYDPPHPGPTASFRDYGMNGGNYLNMNDESDFYEELAPLGPISINKTFEHTTQEGDKTTSNVFFNSDANSAGMWFTGGASGVVNGTSPDVGGAYADAYTSHQWLFDVAEPTTITISGTISVNAPPPPTGGSEVFFTLSRDTGPDVFDYTVDGSAPTLDLTGGNAIVYQLQPGTVYTLLLDGYAFNQVTPGQAGTLSFNISATVPEPASVAGIGLAAMLLGRGRGVGRGRRRQR